MLLISSIILTNAGSRWPTSGADMALSTEGAALLGPGPIKRRGGGIREVFIVTGFRADVIEAHFGDGAKWGARVHYGRQTVQDGTGKAPEVARQFLGDSEFLLTYGDILVRPETYPQMVARFHEG